MTDEMIPWPDILLGCIAGSDRSWRQFVERAHPRVYADLLRMSGDRELARDLSQEVFLKLADGNGRRLRQFDPARGVPFPAYLRAIVVHHYVDWYRGREGRIRGLRVPMEDAPQLWTKPEQELRLELAEAREMLEQLPSRERLALLLRVEEEFTYDEIARVMGIGAGAVGAMISRARSRLRETAAARGAVGMIE